MPPPAHARSAAAQRRWFDAHLDLAYLAVCGRDMHAADPAACGGPDLPAAVTLPTLRAGRVGACLATIFTEADGSNNASYPLGDALLAHQRGLEQLRVYQDWFSRLAAAPLHPADTGGRTPRARAHEVLAPESLNPDSLNPDSPGRSPLRMGILMEGADPIRSPDDLAFWASSGVVAVGLAWVHGSRFAGGNAQSSGLTDLGRALVRAIDDASVVHDLSHLSDASMDELLSMSPGRVIASHSNCRTLFHADKAANQRHLRDESVKEIARRGGVVGLNLFAPFINPDAARDRRASLDDACRHVEHVCGLVGHRRAVGLGSDMDGGFSATMLPASIDRPEHLDRLADALGGRGFCDDDIHAFAWGNWARFWRLAD